MRAAFLNAIDAARKRSEELAQGGDERRLKGDVTMGRGDLKKVRSAKDRQRKVKDRAKRAATEKGAARKAAKRK